MRELMDSAMIHHTPVTLIQTPMAVIPVPILLAMEQEAVEIVAGAAILGADVAEGVVGGVEATDLFLRVRMDTQIIYKE